MPKHRLPPFKALCALEAVVRHGSVTAAAAELCVTHGAVSKQLSVLEDCVGQQLFSQNRGGMIPTDAGLRLARGVARAVGEMTEALDEVRAHRQAEPLRVTAPTSFAMKWLIPRLPDLHRPEIGLKVRVRATHTTDNWLEIPFDVAIRRGGDLPAGLKKVALFRDTLGLVAAPAIAAGADSISRLADLKFLDSETRPGELDRWLARAGIERRDLRSIEMFEHYHIALEAALMGRGALVASLDIAAALVELGQLAVLLPHITVPGADYAAIVSDRLSERRSAGTFVSWLSAQILQRKLPLARL